VTAEVALLMPAIALVLAFCITGVQVVGVQVRVTDAAAAAARVLARGDPLGGAAAIAAAAGGSLSVQRDGDYVCATVDAEAGSLLRVRVSARSCALEGGW
jgi:Flp pilus assembly protein TadG